MTFLLDGFDSDPGDSGLPSSAPAVDEALLAGLNPQQREAVLYRGPALLIVGEAMALAQSSEQGAGEGCPEIETLIHEARA